MTWVPSVSFTGAAATRSRGQMMSSDMLAAGSRSTMYAVELRRLIWVS